MKYKIKEKEEKSANLNVASSKGRGTKGGNYKKTLELFKS
jgi:hypothetical protein